MKTKRNIINIDIDLCDGCARCVEACAEGAIAVEAGKARVISDSFCDGLGACIGECPQGALTIVQRVTDDFDEHAVAEHLKQQQPSASDNTLPCGCPSSHTQSLAPSDTQPAADSSRKAPGLSHWPIQINLVPPHAPFLRNRDLVVAADCTAYAYPDFHRKQLKGRPLLIGCPKFDNRDEYIKKFTEIFSTCDIKSIAVVIMEVPCCSGLPNLIKEALRRADAALSLETIVIGMKGTVVKRMQEAA